MSKAFAINGSPRMGKGNTAMILSPFLEGMKEGGWEIELYYASRLKIKPCNCSTMFCWYERPGECCIRDEMDALYPVMSSADILVLATPVYIPLPGDMQNFINRLCPLITPSLVKSDGRTRARFAADVRVQKMVLVSTGGWWERENVDVVEHIVKELAANSGVEYAGTITRPHAGLMVSKGTVTKDGESIIAAARQAGYELATTGAINSKTLDAVSRPLVSEETYRDKLNHLTEA